MNPMDLLPAKIEELVHELRERYTLVLVTHDLGLAILGALSRGRHYGYSLVRTISGSGVDGSICAMAG